ncbi:hypothetical protein HYU12_03945 [Candidatus Woesearchaeota archaeon]|nr:hypothetical protein [Candidatus Woesearchaeota archaeon]
MDLQSKINKILGPGNGSSKERMAAVKKWADYVRTHPARDWSRIQNRLINKALKKVKALKLTPRQYLEIKGEPCTR